ncbi:MAG: PQQ-binding-like beta-propeller repeat protein, partial [Gemmataceae bacterium]
AIDAAPPPAAEQEPMPPAPAARQQPETRNWQGAPPPVRKPEINADKEPDREVPPTARKATEQIRAQQAAAPREPKKAEPPPARPEPPRRAPMPTPKAVTASWQSAAPPVRKQDGDKAPGVEAPLPGPRARPWRAYLVIALLVGVCISAVVVAVVMNAVSPSETGRAAKAHADFEAGRHASAAQQFQDLVKDFPDSAQAGSYRFHEVLCRFLDQDRLEPDPVAAYDSYLLLAKKHGGSDDYKKHAAKMMAALLRIAGEYVDLAAKKNEPALLAGADAALRDAERLGKPGTRADQIRQRIRAQQDVFARAERIREFRAALADLASNPVAGALDRADELLEQAEADQPNVRQAEGIPPLLERIYEARRKLIQWQPPQVMAKACPPNVAGLFAGGSNGLAISSWLVLDDLCQRGLLDEVQPPLWIAPALREDALVERDKGQIAFALVRGVLYALERTNGEVRWARRVGPDVLDLPVRLPGTDPELILVASSAPQAVSAREVHTGRLHWRVPLESASIGQPVLIGPRAYVPTQAGRVHAIDLIAGKPVGYYEIGQPLGGGAVAQPGTPFLYVPADAQRLFVLDLGEQEQPCTTILKTGHPAGALRGAPQVIDRRALRRAHPREAEQFPDLLVLTQAADLDTTAVRAFGLPIARPDATALAELPASTGWTWFPPHVDAERMLQVTDRGLLTVAGIRQPHTDDPQIFRNFEHQVASVETPARAGLALVKSNDFWLFCDGELHALHFDPYRRELARLGRQQLGAPLHATQPAATDALTSLVTVTQSLKQPTCVATAFDITPASVTTQGRPLTRLHWQRQLGLVPLAAPLQVDDSILVLGRGGCLLRLDASAPRQQKLLAGPNEELDQAVLLRGLDEDSAFVLAQQGKQLLVWHVRAGKIIDDKVYENPAPLAGTPRASSRGLILPLADGKLRYLHFKEKAGADGPAWRARHADRDAAAYVVPLGDDRLLSTDGSRGLMLYRWDEPTKWELLASGEVPARVVSAPLVVKEEKSIEVLVADATGQLFLLREQQAGGTGAWHTVRSWQLGGVITSGPFALGKHVGCMVDNERLVCLSPEQDKPSWEYRRPGDAFMGPALPARGHVIVVHRSGHIVTLDGASGHTAGEVHLPQGVGPACGAILLPEDRWFLPLSDGTVFSGRIAK